MTRIDRDTYELNTGRRIRTSSGVLGLRPDLVESWETRLTGGYDEFRFEGATKRPHGDSDNLLTPAERREIAEYQIKLWAEWGGVTQ